MNTTRWRGPAVLGVALLVAMTMFAAPASAKADDRGTLRKNANVNYGKTLAQFMKLSKAHDGKKPPQGQVENTRWLGLDWLNDGCSAPDLLVGKAWNKFFRDPCVRHDFGYRNFGKTRSGGPELLLNSTNAKKKAIDDKFLADMKDVCRSKRPRPWVATGGQTVRASVAQCDAKAGTFYRGVRKAITGSTGWGNPESAFHGGYCPPGALCLYDDRQFADRRVTFGGQKGYPVDSTSTSVKNLKKSGLNFGDKTSAVRNRTALSWRLYDDAGHKDRSVCVSPGQEIADLKASPWKFGDKTSSLKTVAKC